MGKKKKNLENLRLAALQVKSATQKMVCAHSVFTLTVHTEGRFIYIEYKLNHKEKLRGG